jgi:hypothetical protein
MFDQVRALKQAADQVRTLINWKSANRVIQRRGQLTITTSMRTSDHAAKAKKTGPIAWPRLSFKYPNTINSYHCRNSVSLASGESHSLEFG